MSILAAHQPNYLPWLGYFYKIKHADVFIVLDNVDYQSGNATSVTNRTNIKGPHSRVLLTVPVKADRLSNHISDIRIDNKQNWKEKHLRSVSLNYRKAPYFDFYYDELASVINADWEFLAELNLELIRLVCRWLSINTNLLLSSSVPVDGNGREERLIQFCRHFSADQYLAGLGSQKYHQPGLFEKNDINLIYSQFSHPVYNQQFGEFVAGLSVLDALLSLGPAVAEIIR